MAKEKITLEDLGTDAKEIIEIKKSIITPKMAKGAAVSNANTEPIIVEDASQIIPRKPIAPPPEIANQQAIVDRLDKGLERNKRETLNEIILPAKDKIMAAKLEQELSGEDELAEATTEVKADISFKQEKHHESISEQVRLDEEVNLNNLAEAKLDDDDYDALLEEIKEEEEKSDSSKLSEDEQVLYDAWVEKNQKAFQEEVKSKLNVTIPTGKLRISTASISATKALSRVMPKVVNTASVPLIHSARMITFSALTGDEIPKLRPESYSSELESSRGIYSIIYKHDVSVNKPDFDVWLKSICDWDAYQLYWGLYVATFKDSNYLTYVCNECNNTFIEEKSIEDMFRLDPDCTHGTKERVDEIIEKGELVGKSRLVGNEAIPISQQYAVSIKAPSIYNAVFELSALDRNFRKKYGQLIAIAQYIDNLYQIENGTGVPLQTDVKGDATKSVKLKIIAISKIMSTLTVDEATRFTSLITTLMQYRNDDFLYFMPEADCKGTYGPKKDNDDIHVEGEKCTHHFAEQQTMESTNGRQVRISPLDLIFTREQLSALANFTIA